MKPTLSHPSHQNVDACLKQIEVDTERREQAIAIQRARDEQREQRRAEVTGMDLLKFWGKCLAIAVGVWLLLVVWPLLERVGR